MATFNLNTFLSGHVFAFIFVFSRIGSVLMLFPGIGETYVSPRFRLMLAFLISFLVMEPLLPIIPQPPAAITDLLRLISYEVVTGLFFGTLLRLLVSILENAGAIIAIQTGLSNATILNPALASQSPLSSALMSVAGLTLIFITGLDHVLLKAMIATYGAFPPGGDLAPGDLTQVIIRLTNQSFIVGVELAMPFLIIGLLMQVAVGLMQRIMPQVQLFMVMLPAQLWGGLALLSLTMASMLAYWLQYMNDSVTSFFAP